MLNRLKYFFILIPVITVFIGLFILKDGLLTIIAYHISILSIIIFSGKAHLFKECFKGFKLFSGLMLIVSSSLTGLFMYFLWRFLVKDGFNLGQLLENLGLQGIKWGIFVVFFSIINPVVEEVFWRGFFNEKNKLIIADFGFGVYHILVLCLIMDIPWIILVYIFLTGVSVLSRHFYNKEKGLLIPVLTHLAADTSIIAVIQFMAHA